MSGIDTLNAWVEQGCAGDAPEVIQPAANAEQAALLSWAAEHPIERASIPVNGHGRYHAAPPHGGKAKGHTRATTFAGALDDPGGLTTWRHRLLVRGLCSTDDLVAAVRAAGNDGRALDPHIATALHLAGEKLAADVGSALHLAIEHAVAGTGETPPAPWDADVRAAMNAMADAGWTVDPDLSERCTYVGEYGVIGRADQFVAGHWGDELRILDYKTGGHAERLSYAIQLAIHANASHWWQLDGDGWETAEAVDRRVGYIVHVPAGTGTAQIIPVDLAAGWELAKAAHLVREARTAKSVASLFDPPLTRTDLSATVEQARQDIAEIVAVTAVPALTIDDEDRAVHVDPAGVEAAAPPPAEDAADRTAWIRGRLKTLGASTAARQLVGEGITRLSLPPKPPWTDEQIDQWDALLFEVESKVEAPFPATDPAHPVDLGTAPTYGTSEPAPTLPHPDDGGIALATDVEDLRMRVSAMPENRRHFAAAWAAEARRAGMTFGGKHGDAWSERLHAVSQAAATCALALTDEDKTLTDTATRHVLASVIGEDLHPTWTTGAVFASLTISQANDLHRIASAFLADDEQAVALVAAAFTRAA